MNKNITLYLSLLTAVIILASCTTQSSIYGLWQEAKDVGTIEFKKDGTVIIVDNMSATVTGNFINEENNLITFELTATDIMRDSIQPITKTIITAEIININDHQLQLKFSGQTEVENYNRAK